MDAFCRAAQAANTKISEIGTIAAGEGTASFIDERGKKLSFQPFLGRGSGVNQCMGFPIQLPINPLATITIATTAMCLIKSDVTLAPRFLVTR